VGPSATFLDPFSLDSIEVSRGPGSVAYGSDAFGGVIYARTRRVEPGSPLRFRFQGSLGAGTPEQHAGVELSKGVARGGVLVQASYRNAEDYRSPQGEVFNSGWSGHGLLVRGDHVLGPGLFEAGWQSDFGRDIERPRTNSRTVRFFYPLENSHRFTTSYEVNQAWGFDHIDVTGNLGSYSQVTDQDRVATATQPRSVERADVSARDFQLRGKVERIAGRAKITAGLDLNGRFGLQALDVNLFHTQAGDLDRRTENVSIDNARRTDAGIFGQVETPVGTTVAIAAGVRGDHVRTRNRGGYFGDRSTSHGAASGFASMTASIAPGLSVTGQVSRGFRDPTLSDRYYRGPTGRGFITGSPDLDPERSLQFDLGVRYTAQRYRWAFYAFEYRITDLVERYETATDFFFFRNRGRARIRGAELELQGELVGGLTAELSAQLQRGLALDDDTALDDLSTDTIAARVRRELGARGFTQVRLAVYAADTRPGPTERVVRAHTLLDAAAGYKVNANVELRAVARNVLDQTYELSPDSRAVPAPGISLFGTIILSY